MQRSIISKSFNPEQVGVKTEMLFEANSQIPGSVHYSIKRYARPKNWIADDVGVINYHYEPSRPQENYLEWKFCSIGNVYCRRDQKECSQCKANVSFRCEEKVESVDFLSFVFSSTILEQFVKSRMSNNTLS